MGDRAAISDPEASLSSAMAGLGLDLRLAGATFVTVQKPGATRMIDFRM